MGCVCCSLSSFVSIVLDALERISLCTVCAMLTCCLLWTIIAVMVMGIGIGFHYCFVQNSVDAMAKAAKSAGALRSGGGPPEKGHVMRSLDRAVSRGFPHRVGRREAEDPPLTNENDYNRTQLLYHNLNNTYRESNISNENMVTNNGSLLYQHLISNMTSFTLS